MCVLLVHKGVSTFGARSLPPLGGYVIILVCLCAYACAYVLVCEHDNFRNNEHLAKNFAQLFAIAQGRDD